MQVKKTKKGKISMLLDVAEREKLFGALCNFLEDESVKVSGTSLKTHQDVTRRLYYYTLNEILVGKPWMLESADEVKLSIAMSQAAAILWLLSDYNNDMTLILLKGALHKILS